MEIKDVLNRHQEGETAGGGVSIGYCQEMLHTKPFQSQ